MDVLANTNLLADRNKAFEIFRKSYRKSEVIEENKLLLKEKFQEAKGLGRVVNECKQKISGYKAAIEKRRMERQAEEESSSEEEVEMSAYEKMRLERVKRNEERLKALGLTS